MALVMRIKFPPTYPLIYKTLRIDSKLTSNEAIIFISETLNVAIQGNIGLYIPQERMWLDQNTPLSHYEQLQEVVGFLSFWNFEQMAPTSSFQPGIHFYNSPIYRWQSLFYNGWHFFCVTICRRKSSLEIEMLQMVENRNKQAVAVEAAASWCSHPNQM